MNLALVFRHQDSPFRMPEHAPWQTVRRNVRALRRVPWYVPYGGMHRCSMLAPSRA